MVFIILGAIIVIFIYRSIKLLLETYADFYPKNEFGGWLFCFITFVVLPLLIINILNLK